MSRKWVEKEGPLWVERGIVSREQVNQIVNLYEDKKHAVGLLPILGSILVGLGILSFIAANWQDIPEFARLTMIIVFMAGFYAAGERLVRRGHDKLGMAIVSLGVVSFGAGIILIGQMFHLVAYNAFSFILWASAGALTAYLYRSRYLYLISLLLFNVAQIYSVSEFGTFSYTAFVLMTVGLGWYAWHRRNPLLIGCLAFSMTLHSMLWTTSGDMKFIWMFIPAMALYALGDWVKERTERFALQFAPLAAAFVFGIFMVLFSFDWSGTYLHEHLLAQPAAYLSLLAVLFVLSVVGKLRRGAGSVSSAFEWILLAPYLYLPNGIELMYLLAMFFFSLYVLWRGYAEEWRFKINVGTVLFIVATLIAYGKLTWDFMDKSLFFIIGGVLLLLLSWFLNRRKKQFFHDGREGGERS
ncbi:DUF2157 domain-containing protein [Paenibacillus allorhizosphaerae]|uniref:DUF2157 domain-containing protein n=1 Tax=Paenibacillus allorhizosphaerae TaxID=2849866 RepID=A0ABN7TSU1_9BACL|nr:DUF2157 domain-containing protein [Paenibacillus allorhizosphaerae]CAG7654468.1 hypothetical protein PAECIP111802_05785 [Paenibacillus allorhizosphaerae]